MNTGYQTEEEAYLSISLADYPYAYVVEDGAGQFYAELTPAAAANRLLTNRKRVTLEDQRQAVDLAFNNSEATPPTLRQSDL